LRAELLEETLPINDFLVASNQRLGMCTPCAWVVYAETHRKAFGSPLILLGCWFSFAWGRPGCVLCLRLPVQLRADQEA
jgi:hypothetical protein